MAAMPPMLLPSHLNFVAQILDPVLPSLANSICSPHIEALALFCGCLALQPKMWQHPAPVARCMQAKQHTQQQLALCQYSMLNVNGKNLP
jgi:hypothetical protein